MFCYDTDTIGRWVFTHLGCRDLWNATGRAAFGGTHGGIPAWGVVYERFTGTSIRMHTAIAVKSAVTRTVLRTVFAYPFNELGAKVVIAEVDTSIPGAARFVEKLGFSLQSTIQGGFPNGDLRFYSMTRQQCRWLKGRSYGWQIQSTAAA